MSDTLFMTFGRWLANKREAARLTQVQLAERVGISPNYVSALERDEPNAKDGSPRRLREDKVDRLAKALRVPTDEARLAAGYAPKNRPLKPPTNFAEFVEVLEALGIEQFQRFDRPISDDLPAEEYEMLLEQIRAMVEIVAKRRLPRVLDIEIEPQSEDENVRTNRKTN